EAHRGKSWVQVLHCRLSMTIADVNSFDCGRFVDSLGWVFEHSPWVAERAWTSRPFGDMHALHEAMVHQVMTATHEEQLALLRAHPDLGTRARMSAASVGEQAGAKLSTLTEAELARIDEYRAKFGFPFIYAVKGATIQDILRALETRIQSSNE